MQGALMQTMLVYARRRLYMLPRCKGRLYMHEVLVYAEVAYAGGACICKGWLYMLLICKERCTCKGCLYMAGPRMQRMLVYAKDWLYMVVKCRGRWYTQGVLVYARKHLRAYARGACICREVVVHAANMQGTLVYTGYNGNLYT